MMKKYKKIVLFVVSALIIPSICFADGGVPLLLIINGYVFIFGQVWILLSEFIYLSILLKSQSKKRIFKTTLIMNILSTIIGAFLFPFLLAIITAPGFSYHLNTKWGELLLASGTWVPGDNSPYPMVAIISTILGFVITFILTIWIENKYLKRVIKNKYILFEGNIFKHCIRFNIISYIGLMILFFVFRNI